MEDWTDNGSEIEGKLIASLLDQREYPSTVGNVAAVSDQQISFLKKDRHELVGYRFEFHDVDDCKAIEYRDQMVYYRVVVAIISWLLTAALAFMLVTGNDGGSQEITPLIVGLIATLVFGIRFITSTHRHIINFEMPDGVLSWRSPAIDYKSKAEAAHAVREFARARGILREGNA
jgi:hypothetical protein